MAGWYFSLGKLFAWIGVISVVLLLAASASPYLLARLGDSNLLGVGIDEKPGDKALQLINWISLVSAVASMVAMLGTASTILLGWRDDRRKTKEFSLKIEQLELQLIEARKAAGANSTGQAISA
ncbi:hypothetical protein [Bradyrhizobium diazoefficiens]|uniref:hypothetical protein n=1 Tax=Bradyrhizobium diazoefficiens TaxID=1355477 RepID=UPI0027150FA3|nr:hypothetical protein [Bradyrhizobium diazoefficiens]WLB42108.1 hypothetical protein QIH78_20650 [Bradyrhizobium diazoefficiens]